MTSPRICVELRSDTKTRPTEAMRQAMAAAEVGDEQSGEDPTVNALCERVSDLLGKEAAVFLPSGTMCNAIALAVHCRPGDEIIADVSSHLFNTEAAGAAAIAGAQIRPVPGDYGRFTPADVRAALRRPKPNAPRSRVVAVEQTVNRGGGSVWALPALAEIGVLARANGMVLHMDGARLLNAVIASGVSASAFAAPCDSVWLDLSKGLGCPVGGVLAGSRDFIAEAWRWKHRLGGAMRQAGILAAAGLFALDHHVERLAEDHANATRLADGLRGVPGIALDPPQPETNLVFFEVAGMTAPQLCQRLRAEGIAVGAESEIRLRAVTHLDVDAGGIATAIGAIARITEGVEANAADEHRPRTVGG